MSQPVVHPTEADKVAVLQAFTDDELWSRIGECRDNAGVEQRYRREMERRATKATIEAAKTAKWGVIVAVGSIVIASITSVAVAVLDA